MSFYIVQHTKSSGPSTGSVSATYTKTPISGDLLIATVANFTSQTNPVVSDGTNTWTRIISTSGTTAINIVYIFQATSSQPTTITATLSGKSMMINIYEYSGNASAALALAYDSQAILGVGYTGGTSVSSSGNQPYINPTNATALVFTSISMATNGAKNFAPKSNNALLETNIGSTVGLADSYAIKSVNAINDNPFFTWTNAENWAQNTIAFLPKLAVVQRNSSNSAASVTTNVFTSNNTAGNTILVIALSSANISGATISDTNTNSYSVLESNYNGTYGVGYIIWIAYGIAGGANTISYSFGGDYGAFAYEISGLSSSSIVDYFNSTYITGTGVISPTTISNANNYDLAFVAAVSTGGTLSGQTGWYNTITTTNVSPHFNTVSSEIVINSLYQGVTYTVVNPSGGGNSVWVAIALTAAGLQDTNPPSLGLLGSGAN